MCLCVRRCGLRVLVPIHNREPGGWFVLGKMGQQWPCNPFFFSKFSRNSCSEWTTTTTTCLRVLVATIEFSVSMMQLITDFFLICLLLMFVCRFFLLCSTNNDCCKNWRTNYNSSDLGVPLKPSPFLFFFFQMFCAFRFHFQCFFQCLCKCT